MAKGDMNAMAGMNPANLAQIVSRMKSTQGGGQMGPGQFAGVVPRMPQAPGMAPNNQPYPNPNSSLQARPMMGGFQMPQPTGQANPMSQPGGMMIGPNGQAISSAIPGMGGMQPGMDSSEPSINPMSRLGYGGGNTGIGGLGRSAGRLQYLG